MIKWNTVLIKPPIDSVDKFNIEHIISEKVLVRIIDKDKKICGYSFGRYYYDNDFYSIEDYSYTFVVTHWSNLNEPEINETYVVFEYNEKASASYRGSRFMTRWYKPLEKNVGSHCNIVAENISEEEAYKLIIEANKEFKQYEKFRNSQ